MSSHHVHVFLHQGPIQSAKSGLSWFHPLYQQKSMKFDKKGCFTIKVVLNLNWSIDLTNNKWSKTHLPLKEHLVRALPNAGTLVRVLQIEQNVLVQTKCSSKSTPFDCVHLGRDLPQIVVREFQVVGNMFFGRYSFHLARKLWRCRILGDKGSHPERKVQFFWTLFKRGGQTHVQKLCCKFCIIQRALWQQKLRHRKDV